MKAQSHRKNKKVFGIRPFMEYTLDMGQEQDHWIPACGGTETPFLTRTGKRLLYVYQPSTGRHAYLDCDTDIVLSDQEAFEALGKW